MYSVWYSIYSFSNATLPLSIKSTVNQPRTEREITLDYISMTLRSYNYMYARTYCLAGHRKVWANRLVGVHRQARSETAYRVELLTVSGVCVCLHTRALVCLCVSAYPRVCIRVLVCICICVCVLSLCVCVLVYIGVLVYWCACVWQCCQKLIHIKDAKTQPRPRFLLCFVLLVFIISKNGVLNLPFTP